MSYEQILQIGERGQVVIPKKVREVTGLGKFGRLKLTLKNDSQIILEPIKGFALELEGSARGLLKGKDAVDYVRGLREERS